MQRRPLRMRDRCAGTVHLLRPITTKKQQQPGLLTQREKLVTCCLSLSRHSTHCRARLQAKLSDTFSGVYPGFRFEVNARVWRGPGAASQLVTLTHLVSRHDTSRCDYSTSDVVQMSFCDTHSGSMKITARLDHISHCKTASGTNCSNR